MDNILRAWQSSEGHVFNKPADEELLTTLEQHLHLHLPPELRRLYEFSDGAHVLRGNFAYWPLSGQEISVWETRNLLRAWHYQIPDEILVFADNGSESLFGIWLEPTGSLIFQSPIVEIGEAFEPGCMAVAGTSLVPFLRGWSAYYLLLEDEPSTEALDAISLPDELRFASEDMEDEHFAQLRRWADPKLPDPYVDADKSRCDADALRRLFAAHSQT